MDLSAKHRTACAAGSVNVEREGSGALHVRFKDSEHAHIHRTLDREAGCCGSCQWKAALQAKRRVRPTNFRRLKSYHGIGVVRANGAGSADFQLLIAGFQGWNGQVSLDFGRVFERTFQSCMDFGIALKTLGQAGHINGKKWSERHAGTVD